MGIAMGTRLISMIRNTRRSLIAESRGFALISPRNWLKCSFCKAMNRFSTWRPGTGRVARPVAKRLKGGRVIGVDQALAMLDVGHQHADPIPAYYQSAGEADALPFKPKSFDRAFVSFSLHHFHNSEGVVKEVLRVLKNGGRFVVLDPVVEEAKDSVDIALEAKINQVFRRTHGDDFRFHTASSIQRLANKSGIPHTTDQHFVLLVQSGRHGRYSHGPALAGGR